VDLPQLRGAVEHDAKLCESEPAFAVVKTLFRLCLHRNNLKRKRKSGVVLLLFILRCLD